LRPWRPQASALEAHDSAISFHVTHPYHPLFERTFEAVARSKEYGEERVFYRDQDGRLRFLPVRWTSLAAPDPFVRAAAGRAYFGLEDLIRLAEQLKELEA
jgi:hypothetical protein